MASANSVMRMRSSDRILVLEKIDGKVTLSSMGMADPRLFTGENKLHAVMDDQTCMWSLKYEMGAVPPVLQCKYTSFKALLKHCEEYFSKRNMRIKEVID